MEILNENGKIILKGPLSQADVRNRNGRVYIKDILRESIAKFIYKVNTQNIYSYNEHPSHTRVLREEACGIIKEVTWDEDNGIAYCKVELLEDTAEGKKVIEAVKKGIVVGISTRAIGSLDERGYVLPGLDIITADIIGADGSGIQSCQICQLTESSNTLSDFLIESEEDCKCNLSKLSLKEQILVKEKMVKSIISIFKK